MQNTKHPLLQKLNPTPEEFIQHLQNGGSIKYASIIHTNDTVRNVLQSTDSRTEFNYQIISSKVYKVFRFKFGQKVQIFFKLEFVELIKSL